MQVWKTNLQVIELDGRRGVLLTVFAHTGIVDFDVSLCKCAVLVTGTAFGQKTVTQTMPKSTVSGRTRGKKETHILNDFSAATGSLMFLKPHFSLNAMVALLETCLRCKTDTSKTQVVEALIL